MMDAMYFIYIVFLTAAAFVLVPKAAELGWRIGKGLEERRDR